MSLFRFEQCQRRPVLIISNDDYNREFHDVVVCVLTSNQHKDSYSVALENDDLEIGVLPENSIVKAHKLFTIHQSKIIRKFSLVKDEYFEQVAAKIRNLIEQ
ncbi:MAG: type II toxin-antitoxin system PemK/MazF family toxin [Acidobacteria bacterium]|nr:type II toxin-antitoxin system PemK/MazF family toxin [Acidobacteriota bacterium]